MKTCLGLGFCFCFFLSFLRTAVRVALPPLFLLISSKVINVVYSAALVCIPIDYVKQFGVVFFHTRSSPPELGSWMFSRLSSHLTLVLDFHHHTLCFPSSSRPPHSRFLTCLTMALYITPSFHHFQNVVESKRKILLQNYWLLFVA